MAGGRKARAELEAFVAAEIAAPQPGAPMAAARRIAERVGEAALAVVFYGACLRTGEIDGRVLDFYVIVSSYRAVYGSRLARTANRLLPPNVYFDDCQFEGRTVRFKFAVLSLAALRHRVSERCYNVSVWARFSQPVALVYAADEGARRAVVEAVADAACTMAAKSLPLMAEDWQAETLWRAAFARTYRSELRAERSGKGDELFALYAERYEAITPLIRAALGDGPQGSRLACNLAWLGRRIEGKLVSVLRLIKGAFTYDGGLDYLAWKVSRHSGIPVVIKPWHRRVPIIGGLVLFISLRLKGAFR